MRDKLIGLLEQKYDHYCDQCGVNKQSNYIENLADYLIANGVTFADVPDTNVGKWIPVSERLPEEHDSMFIKLHGGEGWTTGMFRKISDEVLACVENEDGTKTVKQMHTTDGEWRLSSIRRAKVTHWMPLPEPPKEGE